MTITYCALPSTSVLLVSKTYQSSRLKALLLGSVGRRNQPKPSNRKPTASKVRKGRELQSVQDTEAQLLCWVPEHELQSVQHSPSKDQPGTHPLVCLMMELGLDILNTPFWLCKRITRGRFQTRGSSSSSSGSPGQAAVLRLATAWLYVPSQPRKPRWVKEPPFTGQ